MPIGKERIRSIVRQVLREEVEAPPFDVNHPANMVSLGYDKNTRYGDDFAENGGNFMVTRNGKQYYVSRCVSVSLYAFAQDRNGRWYVLANKRGSGRSAGLYNVTCGFVDLAPDGKPQETLEMAACRETFEENGVKIDPNTLVMMGVNSRGRNINASFYCVVEDRTIEEMPPSTENCEEGEATDARWIPLSKVNAFKFAFGMGNKIPYIAAKAIGTQDGKMSKVEASIALLRRRLGNDQESQHLLTQIINGLKS